MLILPFHPDTASAVITIDGVRYRVPIVDSDGHLQVDVLANVLPADAATATNQATMITALQLIDDLRAALDAVRTDRLNVNVYRDGASEVKSHYHLTASDSTTRVTLITPTSGKKIRVISVSMLSFSSTLILFEVYFGTGANITSDASKVVAIGIFDRDLYANLFASWADGGGPVGAADEVLSFRTHIDVGVSGWVAVHYREE